MYTYICKCICMIIYNGIVLRRCACLSYESILCIYHCAFILYVCLNV